MHVFPVAIFCIAVLSLVLISLKSRKNRSFEISMASSGIIDRLEAMHLADSSRLDSSQRRAAVRQWANTQAKAHLAMQIIISVVVLGASTFIILSHSFDAKDKHWAYGSVGTILGYWLKK